MTQSRYDLEEDTEIEPSHYRFTVRDVHRMLEVGILMDDDRVELIDGEVVQMTAQGGRHVACVNRLTELLARAVSGKLFLSVQNAVQLTEDQAPQPDFAVIQRRDYGKELPGPQDVILLVEVSDSTLRYDRRRKLPMYARAGIAETWIVDLEGETIERHTNPLDGSYRITVRVGRGEEIPSVAVPQIVLRADEVLG